MCNTITAMIWRKEKKKLEQIVETRKLEAEDDDDGDEEKNEKNRQNAVWLSLLNDNDILVVVVVE